jgi:hypothetical protein
LRNTTGTRQNVFDKSISLIIPAARFINGMTVHHSFLKLGGGRTLLDDQIAKASQVFPKANIYIVAGEGIEKHDFPANVHVLENPAYAETGTAKSVGIGLRASTDDLALVIEGNVLLGNETLKCFDQIKRKPESCILSGELIRGEVGVYSEGGYVKNMFYGLKSSWLKIVLLTRADIVRYNAIAHLPANKTLLSHEVLNQMVDLGSTFRELVSGDTTIINKVKDIKK